MSHASLLLACVGIHPACSAKSPAKAGLFLLPQHGSATAKRARLRYWLKATPLNDATPMAGEFATCVRSPWSSMANTVGGLAGIGVLELHCTNFQAAHVLLWHTAVVPVSGALGAGCGAVLQRLRSRK